MKFDLKQNNINYVKIVYKDKDDFLHLIKAAVKRIDTKEIFASARFEEKWFIKTPQEVEISFVCENGLYKSKTELKYVDKDDEHVYFALKIPEEVEYRQSREYFRVKLYEKVILQYRENEFEKYIICHTHDISANGLCVVLDRYVDFPEDVKVEILFEKRTVKSDAKYIRTDNEDNIIKASFNFENLKEQDLDYISQVCIQKQLENRRNMLL